MIDYSDFLGVSDSVKRAMNEAKEALTKVGYEVVPFKFEQRIWEGATKAFMGIVAQNASETIGKEFAQEFEPMLKPLAQNCMIMMAGAFKKSMLMGAVSFGVATGIMLGVLKLIFGFASALQIKVKKNIKVYLMQLFINFNV